MPPAAQSDFGPFNYVQDWKNVREETGWWHSFELPDGTEIRGVCPPLTLPASLRVFNQ